MNPIEDIAARKERLVARADQQRASIALTYYEWQARRRVARQAAGILRHPVVLAGLGLVALKMPWRKAFRMGGWALSGWRTLRVIQRMWL